MTKLLKNLWGRFLFQGRGILPTKRLLSAYLSFSLLIILLVSLFDLTWSLIIALNIIIILASLLDLNYSPKKKQLSFRRTITKELERNLTYTVEIEVSNTSEHDLSFFLVDGIPQSFKQPFPLQGKAQKASTSLVTYETNAPVRGKYEIEKLYFRYTSRFGLWKKQQTIGLVDSVKVIPDLTETKHYLGNAQRFLLYEGSKIRKQQRGVGDFAQIRNYVVGDDPRMINWRQTAKVQEVMTNEYEPEHGKYVTILIDCGRMMGAELTVDNRLEKVLEAALTVTAAALKKGDYVSILAFSKEVKVFVPPAKGMTHLQTILQAIYNLKVDPAESNYAAVLTYLETMQKKRSLLLLFSDVRTFLHEESALAYLQRLRQRHLFVMIGIEDVAILKKINEEPVDIRSAMVKSIAQQQILIKKKRKLQWEKQGLQMIEAREEKLAVAAVSHYIDIMNRNLI
ncbi:DUF58 domain-containing protein [Sporosarcina limicola]|uniref:Uncharacterized protein (DUF58 family) n=1 Tax=Sporosarcina limicola TaxID=34101 RepID=A0A927MIE9_9BACL|nr:DUF58 domain-containing protein [Sporosarcina limicola]MBE1555245.1 uncharacterized protein (DUF58 family) [Sporosarcina limicola]